MHNPCQKNLIISEIGNIPVLLHFIGFSQFSGLIQCRSLNDARGPAVMNLQRQEPCEAFFYADSQGLGAYFFG